MTGAEHGRGRPPVTVSQGAGQDELTAFLVNAASAATPFHSAAWGQAIEAATGHRWHLLVARDATGAMVGLLPLHHIRSRLFGSALVSAGFAVGGGIVADDDMTAAALADAAIDLARDCGVDSVELRGGCCPAGWQPINDSHLGFVRPLAADDEAELLAIPRKHRAEVRKALGHVEAGTLRVDVGKSAASRDGHFSAYATSVRNLGTPVFPRRLFDAVLDHFGADADIVTVRHGDAVVASVLSLYWGGAVMPYWGGGTMAARGLRANELMYFALMRHARERGITRFDFGRSKVGSGPAAYKKNWGFEPAPLGYARWSATGEARDINPNSGKYQAMVRLWKQLPLPVANRLGPIIARQLG